MNESKKELIKSYFYKKLSEAEKKEILAQVEASKDLKEEFTSLELLQKVAERNRILEQAKQIHENRIAEFKTPKGRVISWTQVSSAAVAACLIATLYLGNSDFEFIEISSTERGNDTTETALTDLEKGLNFLQKNEPKMAFEYFQIAKNNTELTDYYRDAARWYEVVSYAEMDLDKEAKALLNQIENSTGFTYKVAWIEKLKMRIRLIV